MSLVCPFVSLQQRPGKRWKIYLSSLFAWLGPHLPECRFTRVPRQESQHLQGRWLGAGTGSRAFPRPTSTCYANPGTCKGRAAVCPATQTLQQTAGLYLQILPGKRLGRRQCLHRTVSSSQLGWQNGAERSVRAAGRQWDSPRGTQSLYPLRTACLFPVLSVKHSPRLLHPCRNPDNQLRRLRDRAPPWKM